MKLETSTDLTLDEQAALTAGIDFWHTAPVERLGIKSLRVTDGPAGARGHRWSVGASASLPCGSALAATWNRELVKRVGNVLADEARRKGAGVLLGPTVNIHRHPLNGRHFESFSEDPLLSSEMAVAYIEGVQEHGVGACVKHLVCNDQEYERQTISVEIEEGALREIYLPAFEAAVQRAGVWSVMGAYNRLRGTYCCENAELLVKLLRDEWGFDGVVISDWFGTHSTTAVSNGLDLEMPGPAKYMGPFLVESVERGEVARKDVVTAAGRVLRLMDQTAAPPPQQQEDPSKVARAAAAEAIVLLKNDGVLPLDTSAITRVAVIGAQADRMAPQGGGSAEVTPSYVTSPLEAIRRRVEVLHEPGCTLPGPTPVLDARWVKTPHGEPGIQVDVFAGAEPSGEPVSRETMSRTLIRWGGARPPGIAGRFAVRAIADFEPDRSGSWEIGLASAGTARLLVDGGELLVATEPNLQYRQGTAERVATLDMQAGRPYRFVAEFSGGAVDSGIDLVGMRIGARPRLAPDARARAVQAAKDADVAVVVVGYDGAWECEGSDRPHMDLPGDQDDLVQAIAAANPKTVVVINAGAPVTMRWAEDVAAILELWFPGMEGGSALGDVLFGDVDASGRLPTTFPQRLEDSPAFRYYPGENGVVEYREGLLVGYRHYDKAGIEPLFCFGHGLSYTRFDYDGLQVQRGADGHVDVAVRVTNVGSRDGREVVQLYVRDPSASSTTPDNELRDFAKLDLRAGESQVVSFVLPERAFAHWDVGRRAWRVKPGERELLIGASSRDIRCSASIVC